MDESQRPAGAWEPPPDAWQDLDQAAADIRAALAKFGAAIVAELHSLLTWIIIVWLFAAGVGVGMLIERWTGGTP